MPSIHQPESKNPLPGWAYALIGTYVFLWSLVGLGGGWFPIYGGAYVGMQLRDPAVARQAVELAQKKGLIQDGKLSPDGRERVRQLARSGKLEDLPEPIRKATTVAKDLAPKFKWEITLFAPLGLMLAAGIAFLRKWRRLCALVWMALWIPVTVASAIALRPIATRPSVHLMALNLAICVYALWALSSHPDAPGEPGDTRKEVITP